MNHMIFTSRPRCNIFYDIESGSSAPAKTQVPRKTPTNPNQLKQTFTPEQLECKKEAIENALSLLKANILWTDPNRVWVSQGKPKCNDTGEVIITEMQTNKASGIPDGVKRTTVVLNGEKVKEIYVNWKNNDHILSINTFKNGLLISSNSPTAGGKMETTHSVDYWENGKIKKETFVGRPHSGDTQTIEYGEDSKKVRETIKTEDKDLIIAEYQNGQKIIETVTRNDNSKVIQTYRNPDYEIDSYTEIKNGTKKTTKYEPDGRTTIETTTSIDGRTTTQKYIDGKKVGEPARSPRSKIGK